MNGSYYLHPNRPGSAQSSSERLGRSSLQTRLGYSSVNTPSPKRPLVNVNHTGSPSATPPLNGHHSRVGEYHMSRQNPNVLDQMYSPNEGTEGGRAYSTGNGVSPYTPLGKLNGHHTPGAGISQRLAGPGSVSQVSFVRQMLNSRRARSASPGLVQLANRNGPVGRRGVGQLLKNGVIRGSPVTVKLAGVKGAGEDKEEPVSRMVTGSDQVPNPCDKEVVLSALRQKRKRWASSAPEESASLLTTPPVTTPLPQAKRSRTDNQAPTEYMYTTLPPPTNERKRSNAIPASVPSLKRSKVTNAICQLTPEVEAVRLSTPPPSVLPSTARREVRPPAAPAGVVINGDLNIGRGSRGQTPPIVIDEAEMDRKRGESLNTLKAVFTSSSEAKKSDSMRRKLPIFCATGEKPYLPSPLSATHSVTQEDLRKDREANAARLKAFLEAEDETDGKAAPKTSEGLKPLTTASGQLKLATVTASTASGSGLKLGAVVASTAESAKGLTLNATSVAVTKSLSTKTVSFAPLPAKSSSTQPPSLTLSGTTVTPASGGNVSSGGGGLKLAGNIAAPASLQSSQAQGLTLAAQTQLTGLVSTAAPTTVSASAAPHPSLSVAPQQTAAPQLSLSLAPQKTATPQLSISTAPQQTAAPQPSLTMAPQQTTTPQLAVPQQSVSTAPTLSFSTAPQLTTASTAPQVSATPQFSLNTALNAAPKQLQATGIHLPPNSQLQTSGSLFQTNPNPSAYLSGSLFGIKPSTTSAPASAPTTTTATVTTVQPTPFAFKLADNKPTTSQSSLSVGGGKNLFGLTATTSQPSGIGQASAKVQSSASTGSSQAPPTFSFNGGAGQSLFNTGSQSSAQPGVQASGTQSSIFGQNSVGQATIFGQSSQGSDKTSAPSSIFGQKTQSSAQSTIFGLNSQQATQGSSQSSIFGQSSQSTGFTSIFGQSTSQSSALQPSQTSLATSQPSLFNTQNTALPTGGSSIFGKSASSTINFNLGSTGSAQAAASTGAQQQPGAVPFKFGATGSGQAAGSGTQQPATGQGVQFNFSAAGNTQAAAAGSQKPQGIPFNFGATANPQAPASGTQQPPGGIQFNFSAAASKQGSLFGGANSAAAGQTSNLTGQTNLFNTQQSVQGSQSSIFGKSLAAASSSLNVAANKTSVPASGSLFGQGGGTQVPSSFQFGASNPSAATGQQQTQGFSFNTSGTKPSINFGTGTNQQQTGNVFGAGGGGGGNMFQSQTANFGATGSPSIFSATATTGPGTEASTPNRKMATARRRKKK